MKSITLLAKISYWIQFAVKLSTDDEKWEKSNKKAAFTSKKHGNEWVSSPNLCDTSTASVDMHWCHKLKAQNRTKKCKYTCHFVTTDVIVVNVWIKTVCCHTLADIAFGHSWKIGFKATNTLKMRDMKLCFRRSDLKQRWIFDVKKWSLDKSVI